LHAIPVTPANTTVRHLRWHHVPLQNLARWGDSSSALVPFGHKGSIDSLAVTLFGEPL
jgi:hypothetical protein